MKKRLLACVLALALCAGMCPALGAEEMAVFQPGAIWWYFDRETVMVSADQGGSYAPLPGLEEYVRLSGLSLDHGLVMVKPLAGGGLRVEAQGRWYDAGTDTLHNGERFLRDYPAEEVAQALAQAVPTPIRVLAASPEGVTVATRHVWDTADFDLGAEAAKLQYFWPPIQEEDQLLVSTNGVDWSVGEWPEDANTSGGAWWDGTAFYAGYGGLTSADGVQWRETGETRVSPKPRYAADLGPYHFELVRDEEDGHFKVYLMDRTSGDTGVLLPHMGEAIPAEGLGGGEIQAWCGPDETVFLAVYDPYQKERYKVCINYPTSSLDWCLENLSQCFRAVGTLATDGEVALGAVAGAYNPTWEQAQVVRNDGTGWKRLTDVPWGPEARVLPYNGKTFLVADTAHHHLYASEDGLAWTVADALRPAEIGEGGYWDYIHYAFAWTGSGYIACREAAESQHGMMGSSGGWWYEGNTSVYFLDGGFQLTGSHDFGRLVEAVGWNEEAYYAQVSNSDGGRYGWSHEGEKIKAFDRFAGSTLYRSTDGKTWEALPDIYLTIEEVMVGTRGCYSAAVPTGDPAKPQRGIAQLDDWRFVLAEDNHWDDDGNMFQAVGVYLLKEGAMDWVELPDLRRAILDSYITPGELTAEYNADGTVEVSVTDLYTPSLRVSISYPADSLDWVKENLGQFGYRAGRREEQYKPGVADVMLLGLPNGERELLYRTSESKGQYMWYNSVPWSNSISLLPYNGNTFLVWDAADGRIYTSEDGLTWTAAENSWMDAHPQVDGQGWRSSGAEYAFVWTGDGYLACYYGYYTNGRFYSWLEDCGWVTFLDENFQSVRSHSFGRQILAVGYWEGVYYAQVANSAGYTGPEYKPEEGFTLYRSTDGENWEPTDVLSVRAAMKETC